MDEIRKLPQYYIEM